jgi:hypothetical protein
MTPAAIKRASKAYNKSLITIAEALLTNPGYETKSAYPGEIHPRHDYMVYDHDFGAYGPKRRKFGDASMWRVLVVKSDHGPEAYASDGTVLLGPINGDTTGHRITPSLGQALPEKNRVEVHITGRVQRGTDPGEDGPVPVYGNYTVSTGVEVNPVYLASALAFIGESGLVLRQEAGNPLGPLVIQGSEKLALIMPIRAD